MEVRGPCLTATGVKMTTTIRGLARSRFLSGAAGDDEIRLEHVLVVTNRELPCRGFIKDYELIEECILSFSLFPPEHAPQ